MGKALVIKGVDFGAQKLATVSFSEDTPCTALSLSDSTKTMTTIGSTFTLTATKTPANTTDALYWATSNEDIATVDDSVVTQTGIGTVVITATCGEQTATCTVTATNAIAFNHKLSVTAQKHEGTYTDYVEVNSAGSNEHYAAIFQQSTPTTKKVNNNTNNAVAGSIYPLILGNNGTTLTINVPSSIRPIVWFVDKDTMCTYGETHSSCAEYAKFISGDASPYDSNVPLGNRTVTIPEGANAVLIGLQKPGSGNAVTEDDISATTIAVS